MPPHNIDTIVRLQQIATHFQPIIDVRQRTVLAYEALARGPSDGHLHAPGALFAAAASSGVLPQLELTCVSAALGSAAALGLTGRLFINLSPHSLLSDIDWPRELEALCRRHSFEPGACVLELTEQSLVEDYDRICKTLHALRARGFDFAIDDFGTGYSGLRMWSEVRPDFIKIDRYFASGIERDPVKLEFVRSIIDMSRAVGSRIIVEGVETPEECRELLELDVDGLQGYLFARPQPTLVSSSDALAPLIALRAPEPPSTAENLIVETAPVRPSMRVADFVRLVQASTHCTAFPVVDEAGTPVGMVWRDRFLVTYSKPLHPEVLAKKPVSAIMDTSPLIVDARLRLEQTSRLVTRKSRIHGTDVFIITRDGRYAGVGHTIDLLTHITEGRIRAATHSNPLTALPGNVPIHDNVTRLIQQARPFVICYVDLDHFKPFNDHYGYARGDQVLLQLAQVLRAAIAPRTDFVGHIGGDDFIVILRSVDWPARLARAIEEFSARVRAFYSPEDLARGGIEALDRFGERRLFRMLSISVAVLDSRSTPVHSAEEVSERLQTAKRSAKAVEGNCLWGLDGTDGGGGNLLEDPEFLARAQTLLPASAAAAESDTGSFEEIAPLAAGD